MERTVPVIDAGLEEIIKNLILIGCTNQFAYRDTHLLCIKSSQNISKVAGRYDNVHLLTGLQLTLCQQSSIRIDIVYNLWNKPPDIDRICRRKAKACL